RDTPHRMHGDGPADHFLPPPPGPVDPGDIEGDLLLERDGRNLGGDAADGGGLDPDLPRDALRRLFLVQIALRHQLDGWHRLIGRMLPPFVAISGTPVESRANKPSFAAPALRITSHAALV